MNEWIDRRVQEPPKDVEVLAYAPDAKPGYRYCFTTNGCVGQYEYWMPLPAPPARNVTIEIEEDLAEWYATADPGNCIGGMMGRMVKACAAALSKK